MVNVMALMGYGQLWATGGMSQGGLAMSIAVSMVVLTMFRRSLFHHFGGYLELRIRKLISSLDPYVQIKFHEDTSDGGPKNHKAYAAIETYLSANCSGQAPRLKANSVRDIKTPVLCIDEGESLSDEFNGIKVWWHLSKDDSADPYHRSKKYRYYTLTFRKSNRKIVVGEYLKHVMQEGSETVAKNRQLKLYSNSSADQGSYWNFMGDFDHSATFDTVAMENEKKQDTVEDLIAFSNAREYYRRIGKPWKRGYLLYGPPGTGKTTMIAAIANLLSYHVYDLELTAVLGNASLKRLLTTTPCNSILVIEDIDCLSNITGKRETKPSEDKIEKVTLSGLLNCVDGLFSANEGGRLMIFTTNHVENLDSALIRSGRMDKHIEMSFCGFEAFKVLAKNYLDIDKHKLFPKIQILLKEVQITPADVAENLNAKSACETSANACLETLIGVLEKKLEEKNKLISSKEGEKEEQKESEEREGAKENGVVIINENGYVN